MGNGKGKPGDFERPNNPELRTPNSELPAVMATNFCGSISDEVIINPVICKVYMPNAFTPNGDVKK